MKPFNYCKYNYVDKYLFMLKVERANFAKIVLVLPPKTLRRMSIEAPTAMPLHTYVSF